MEAFSKSILKTGICSSLFFTMAEAPVVLTAKQAAALARIERQELNLERIKLANSQFYREQAADIDLTPVPPERKQAFILAEDNRPYLGIGEYVKVESKTDAGYNRPEGYGYIHQTFGVGLAALYSVKYTPAFDGGRVHKQVRLGDLTPCSPFDECLAEESRRKRKPVIPEPELVEEVVDDRLPIQKLCDCLITGARRGKAEGWHRRALQLGNGRYMNPEEQRQFRTELMLLEQHLAEPSVQKLKHERKMQARYKKSKKFRKMKTDPITLTYFVQTAWGLSSSFLSKFKAKIKAKTTEEVDCAVDFFTDDEVKVDD